MKAVTTPFPLDVLILAFTLPYHMYVVVARTVPTDFGGMVRRVFPLKIAGSPCPTQSASFGSPRYFDMSLYRSSESILYVLSLHTGAGAHESSENDIRGSQPPRQK